MTHVERMPSLATRLLQTVGWIALALAMAFCAMTAPLWFRSRTVQYYVYPSPAASAAAKGASQTPGCELYGKRVRRGGQEAIRFRFPNDAELIDCFKQSVPSGSRIEKASWLDTRLNRPRPAWL